MLTISMNGIAQTTGIVERNNKGVISFVKYLQQNKNEVVTQKGQAPLCHASQRITAVTSTS